MSDFLKVGEVFICPRFATDCSYEHDDGKVNKNKLEIGRYQSEVTHAWTERKEGGWSRPRSEILDVDAHDPSRATAPFVVTKTEMSGGGTAHGPGDVYPDGWGVTAVRLHKDNTWNPDGEEIFFRQSGSFTNGVLANELSRTTLKMKVTMTLKVE